MVFQNNVLSGAGGSGTTVHTIDQSIRFNEADDAYMHRTPSSSSNQRTWTWSGWLKHTMTSTNGFHNIWSARSDNNNFFGVSKRVTASGDNYMDITNMTSSSRDFRLITNRQFRDPSAWYHFVFVLDTTQAVASERVRFYVNGQRETSFSTETYPSQNLDTFINTTNKHEIGAYNGGSGYMMDGYMAEITFIDGQALYPSSFGEYNSSNIWIPKNVSGLTFGTNGFHIDGRDASDLGDDESGNGNDFTTSGLAAHDQVLDSPTNNFSTLNPLDNYYFAGTFKDGNLDVTTNGTTGNYTFCTSTQKIPTSGKWYTEVRAYEIGTGCYIGITQEPTTAINIYLGKLSTTWGYYSDGRLFTNDSGSSYGNSYANGDIIGIAVDMDNNKLYFSKGGTFQNSGDPTSGSTGTGAISITGGVDYFLGASDDTGAATTSRFMWNFGQDGTFCNGVTAQGNKDASGIGNFYYSVPSGFKALCTKNLGS